MTSNAIVPIALSLISVTLALSLVVGWAALGRERHALLWAGAFGLGAVQWGLIFVSGGGFPSIAHMLTSSLAGTGVTLLLLAGFATRAGAAIRGSTVLVTAAIVCAIVLLAFATGQLDLARAMPHLSRALLLPLAMLTMYERLRQRSYAEVFAAAVLAVFAVVSLIIGCLRLVGTDGSGDLAHLLASIGLPVAFANLGAATLLLLASDLSGRLQRLAATDPLTGLLNRRGFSDATSACPADVEAAVLMIDVDRFKAVNDNYGHAVGDAVLVQIAECLRRAVRSNDVVGRLGGDEFAVMLTGASLRSAEQTAERIRSSLATSNIRGLDGFAPTVSIGIAPLRDGQQVLADAIKEADRVLYETRAGRSTASARPAYLRLVQQG